MARGGPRPNSGRPKGSIDVSARASKAIAKRVMKESDLSPIEVMFANMLFWHKHSENLAIQIQALMSEASKSNSDGAVDILDRCEGMMKSFLESRENAQRCAVDAAPYCHPRLQAIKFEGEKETLLEVTMALAPPKVDEEAESRGYRDGYTSVVPLRRNAA